VQYEIYGDLYYRNAARTDRFGVEFKSRLELARNLDLTVGYAHAHYEYIDYAANSLEADSTGNIVAIQRDFSGHFEPNIPSDRVNLSLDYRYPVREELSVHAGVSYLAAAGLWVDDNNSQKTGSYQVLDAEAGVDMKFGHFLCSVKGGVNNTFDRVFAGTANINSADRRYYNAGSPRDFVGSVIFDYLF
jgi:iron complex outermembrane receptor protein